MFALQRFNSLLDESAVADGSTNLGLPTCHAEALCGGWEPLDSP
jgi:hypothetical protein